MIVTIGPSRDHTEETLMSLQFASRAMNVENQPFINKKLDYRVLNLQLQNELDEVNDKLIKLEIRFGKSKEKILELKEENQ